jgi:hypothetical protein
MPAGTSRGATTSRHRAGLDPGTARHHAGIEGLPADHAPALVLARRHSLAGLDPGARHAPSIERFAVERSPGSPGLILAPGLDRSPALILAPLATIEGLAAERATGNSPGAAARRVEGLATDRRP